jgi:phospholipase/carboxylesterase
MAGDRQTNTPREVADLSGPLVEARFVPRRYEPNYAYPLLVLLHGRGGNEQQLVDAMPAMSWRNYIGLGLRGPEVVNRRNTEVSFGWGPSFSRPDRPASPAEIVLSDAETIRRIFQGEPTDVADAVERGVFSAVRDVRRSLHVHSERIFLVGSGEGAAVAYRLGLSHPDRFAGVVSINGWIPRGFRPLRNYPACRDLKVLVVHGEWNNRSPIERARRDVNLLRAAGMKVAFQTYPCANRLTSPMLSDVDTWLMNQCTAEL